MGYKYVYKRGCDKNPVPDYHKKYIEVHGKKVMTTRYTYEIALSKHWPDRSECTGPRGGKAVREFARYVWYADGMFYAVKRKCTGEDRFGNELVPLSGVIWDCHKAQTEAQGIPVVEITLKDGRPVSVLMDGDNIEVTDENWPIAEELLYLNGARCPRSANKRPSKPRKRAQKKAAPKTEPKVVETPKAEPILVEEPTHSDEVVEQAEQWLSAKHHYDVWVADYAKRQGKTEKEVWDELIAGWRAPVDYARFGLETPNELGTFEGYSLSECSDGGRYFYTVITPWGLCEGLWTPDYRDDEHAIELLKEVVAVINDRMGLKAAA
jgi:hypothetical protein